MHGNFIVLSIVFLNFNVFPIDFLFSINNAGVKARTTDFLRGGGVVFNVLSKHELD